MKVNFFTESLSFKIKNPVKIKNWIKNSISDYNKIVGDINFIFTSDLELQKINVQYLNKDYFTDIITFNYCNKNIISGDIYISIDRVKNNAEKYKQEFNQELRRIIIHGILHLIGFNDKTKKEKELMTKEEDKLLKKYVRKI